MIADTTELVRVVGQEAAATLVQVAGGLALRIPRNPPLDGPLADLPLPAQDALIAWAGGDVLYVPKCDGAARARRDAEIIARYDAGASVRQLAREYRLSERWVYEILGRATPDTAQGSLF